MTTFKEFAGKLRDSASRAAESIGLGRLVSRQQHWKVTGKCAQRGSPYRRTIGYKRTGPFYEQVATRPDGKPVMRQSYYHKFLHATKGLRTLRTFGPTVTLANLQEPRVYGPRATGYQSHHGWINPSRLVLGSAGAVLVPYFKKDKKKVGQQHPGMHTMPRGYIKRPRHHNDVAYAA